MCVCSGGGGGGGGEYSPMKMSGFEEQTAKSRTGLLFFFHNPPASSHFKRTGSAHAQTNSNLGTLPRNFSPKDSALT